MEDDWSLALPFERKLELQDPLMSGKDVVILQNLLQRCKGVNINNANGYFNEETRDALAAFQLEENLNASSGVLNPDTAKRVLELLMPDGYKDDGIVPDDCQFKLHVPVYRDRDIETNATLYKSGNGGEILHVFKIRTRGGSGKQGQVLNQLTTYGNTPTGLSTFDLNSKEPEQFVKKFGPYPVLRVVKGLKGNSAIGKDDENSNEEKDTFLSNYRSGILLHTGIWDEWDKTKPMPNSLGCMHVAPDDMERIINLLIEKTDATVNENPFGKLPYPYKAQGIISIEDITL